MKRALAVLTLTALAGCTDLGLEGNVPLEEARHAPLSELVAAVHGQPDADEALVMAGQLWVPWGLPVPGDRLELRPIGSVRGVTLHARAWDRAPFDALFAPEAGEWQGHAPVIGGGGPTAGR